MRIFTGSGLARLPHLPPPADTSPLRPLPQNRIDAAGGPWCSERSRGGSSPCSPCSPPSGGCAWLRAGPVPALRTALDRPCAPRPPEGVGTKGVPRLRPGAPSGRPGSNKRLDAGMACHVRRGFARLPAWLNLHVPHAIPAELRASRMTPPPRPFRLVYRAFDVVEFDPAKNDEVFEARGFDLGLDSSAASSRDMCWNGKIPVAMLSLGSR